LDQSFYQSLLNHQGTVVTAFYNNKSFFHQGGFIFNGNLSELLAIVGKSVYIKAPLNNNGQLKEEKNHPARSSHFDHKHGLPFKNKKPFLWFSCLHVLYVSCANIIYGISN
jgi:hypothetical protein